MLLSLPYWFMPVRLSPEWFVLADERILEIISDNGAGTPKSISDDNRTHFGREYLGRRLRKLHAAGLLDKVGRGNYVLTEDGEAYLEGEFDARDLDKPE